MKKTLSIILLVLISSIALAQNFPVQSNIIITPPYSVYLSDYASSASNKMMVNLMLKDISQPDFQIKLHISIKGSGVELSTKADYMPAPLTMQSGTVLQISGNELEAYLHPDNLNFLGISKQEFAKTGKLPEGVYQFCVQAVEYRRGVPVSNNACAITWLMLNDPPRFLLPENNKTITATNPQNLFFTWMPMNTGSPNSAFTTEYEFTLVEIWPDNRNPNDAINSTMPLYQTTTINTALSYGPAEPQLVPGRKYVCRLRAYDTEGRDLFKNHGYSQILVFTFGRECLPPININHSIEDYQTAKATWQMLPGQTEYRLSYGEQNPNGTWSNWYYNESILPYTTIKDLKPEHTYRYKLMATCGAIESEYSETKEFTTPKKKENEIECGKDLSIPEIDDSPPLENLKVGDKINVGGFTARVIECEGSGGTFSGKCVVHVTNFGFWVQSEFKNISINQSMQVTAGEINAIKGELRLLDVDALLDSIGLGGGNDDDYETDPNVGDPYSPGDTIIVTLGGEDFILDSDTTIITTGGDIIITELGGIPPIIIINGDTTEITTDELDFDNTGGGGTNVVTQNDSTDYAVQFVEFKPIKDQQFGFDEYPPEIPQYLSDYDKEKINGNDYIVPWKSNQSMGLPDKVEIHISVENPDSINTRLSIESSITGPIAFEASPSGEDTIKVITLNGQSHESEDRITAYYTKDDGTKVAVGYLNMVSYSKQNMKVVVVPVNENYTPSAQEIKAYLDNTYKTAITFWDVSLSTTPLEVDFEDNETEGLDTELPEVAALTKEMRSIKRAMKNRGDYDKDAYYIFLVKKSEKGQKNGIMPFRRHFGFIFMENSQQLKANSQKLNHTIAHELAHGAFGLEHPWQSKGTTQGDTYNLLDYTTKTPNNLLRKYQWYIIHNPKMSLFGGDEEEVSDVTPDANAKYIVKIYSPYISHKLLWALNYKDKDKRANRLISLIVHSMVSAKFTKEKIDWIKRGIREKYKDYLPNIPIVANMKVNPGLTKTGYVFYLLCGKQIPANSEDFDKIDPDFFVIRREYGTLTRMQKDKEIAFEKIIPSAEPASDFYLSSVVKTFFWPTWGYSKLTGKILAYGMSVELKGGVILGGLYKGGFKTVVDRDENIALVLGQAGFINFLNLFIAGEIDKNFTYASNVGLTWDFNFTTFEHVSELSGVLYDIDYDPGNLDGIEADISINLDRNNEYRGVEISVGFGVGKGYSSISGNKTTVYAFRIEDLLNLKNSFIEALKIISAYVINDTPYYAELIEKVEGNNYTHIIQIFSIKDPKSEYTKNDIKKGNVPSNKLLMQEIKYLHLELVDENYYKTPNVTNK